MSLMARENLSSCLPFLSVVFDILGPTTLCVFCLTYILLVVAPMVKGQLGENGKHLSPLSVLDLL